MKVKLNNAFLFSLIIIEFSTISFAQNNPLPQVFEKYIQNKLQSLKDEWNDENKDMRKVFYTDLNKDGLKDAILQFQFLFSSSEFGNTVVSKIFFAVFLKGNNEYKLVDEIDFSGGNMNVPGLFSSIELVTVQKNKIEAKVYRFNVYDGHCCPSYTEEVEFKFENNKLIPLQEIKDEKFVYPKIGDQIDFGEFFVRVDNVEFLERIGNNYVNLEADGVFLLLDLTITNHKNYPVTLYSNFFELKDDDSNTYKIAVNVLPYLELMKRKTLIVEEISPKVPKKITFVYEVPSVGLYFLVGAKCDYDLPSTICLVNSGKEYFYYKEK
jgi:DNA-directed RNA polymerase delta subunit